MSILVADCPHAGDRDFYSLSPVSHRKSLQLVSKGVLNVPLHTEDALKASDVNSARLYAVVFSLSHVRGAGDRGMPE